MKRKYYIYTEQHSRNGDLYHKYITSTNQELKTVKEIANDYKKIYKQKIIVVSTKLNKRIYIAK